jgi:hypothetical protein
MSDASLGERVLPIQASFIGSLGALKMWAFYTIFLTFIARYFLVKDLIGQSNQGNNKIAT